MIKTWQQRCEEHPDHQTGMVSGTMIEARMQEEIDELRAALEELEKAALQGLQAMDDLYSTGDTHAFDLRHKETTNALRAALRERLAQPRKPTTVIYRPADLAALGLTHEDVVKLIKEKNT